MEGVSRGHSDGHACKESELAAALRQAEAELALRKRVEEELHLVIAALEKRVTEGSAEVAAANQKLRLENHTRVGDQREIRQLTENLVRREQAFSLLNQELESLSYGISHDLRSPLRHLIGFSGALMEDFADKLDGTAREYLNCISRAGRKMESRMEALLDLSRITRQELRLEYVDLSELARDCAASLQESAPERSAVFSIAATLPVYADAELMKVAIGNLVGNAWKFTAHKESACIELDRKEVGSSSIYYIRDNGAGFEMQYADRLFGPFQRLHGESEFEGTGIGLAMVQRVIHRHGGRIWADAAVDRGATFFFTLSDRSSSLEM